MIPRRHIIPNRSLSHVFFRCHNRQFLLKPNHVKEYLILLWARFKEKYGIKIYEAIVLDNHAHLLLKAPSSEALGNFMRTVNSLLARYINHTFKRDSQAIRERYKSPLITSGQYFKNAMTYIWLNRYKIDKSNPLTDPYCSAAWRSYQEYLLRMGDNDKERALLSKLLDDHEDIYPKGAKETKHMIIDMLNASIGSLNALADIMNASTHTIGDEQAINFRGELLKSMKKEAIPWKEEFLSYH